MQGSRNVLRNKAQRIGGNFIYIQRTSDAHSAWAAGTTATSSIAAVYDCQPKKEDKKKL